MAVIVVHKVTKQRYILVGTGFGSSPSMTSSPMFGTILPDGGLDETKMVAVCADSGMIHWFKSNEIEVAEIDGQKPIEFIQQ